MDFIDYIESNTDHYVDAELYSLKNALLELTPEELDNLGEVIFDLFFEDDYEEIPDIFGLIDVIDMVDELRKEMGQEAVDTVFELLEIDEDAIEESDEEESDEDDDEDEDDEDDEEESKLDEAGPARRMKVANMNKKKRKFMTLRKTDLLRTKVERKRKVIKGRMKKRRYFKNNKIKIKAYQKSRSAAIANKKHTVKIRKN